MAQRDEDAPWLAEAAPLRAAPKKRPLLNIVIAVLVRGVLTVGTVLEIQHAVDHMIPVVVLGDIGQNSVALAELEVPVIASMKEFQGDWNE